MTEAQRLINNYLTNVSNVLASKFRLRYFCKLQDEAARQMLADIIIRDPNQCYQTAWENVKTGAPIEPYYDSGIIQIESSIIQNGHSSNLNSARYCLEKYAFNQAYQFYLDYSREVTHSERPYLERATILILQRKWFDAYRTACKSTNPELQFITKFAAGRFNEASADIMMAYTALNTNSAHFISDSEFYLLAAITAIADQTPEAVETNILPMIIEFYPPGSRLYEFIHQYQPSSFCQFLDNLSELDSLLECSYYANDVIDKLKKQIISNILKIYIFPLTNCPIQKISEDLHLEEENIIIILKELILSHQIDGKINFADKTYIGAITLQTEIEYDNLACEMIAMRKKLSSMIQKQLYKSFKPAEMMKTQAAEHNSEKPYSYNFHNNPLSRSQQPAKKHSMLESSGYEQSTFIPPFMNSRPLFDDDI